jgi:hypothetical protein
MPSRKPSAPKATKDKEVEQQPAELPNMNREALQNFGGASLANRPVPVGDIPFTEEIGS